MMVINKKNNIKIFINTIIRKYIIYTYQDQKNLNKIRVLTIEVDDVNVLFYIMITTSLEFT